MTFAYDEIADLADELIREFGQTVTVTMRSSGAYDPATGASTVTETTQTCTGAVFDYSLIASGAQNADGSMILATDKQLLLSPYTTAGAAITRPVPDGTRVTVGSTVYTVKNVKAVEPAGTPVMYDCNLRF